jgi:outer membrane protein OmpA-like peptidoglycan-associated protein
MSKEDSTYWVTLNYFNGNFDATDGYYMSVAKIEEMKQEITANEMFEKVNSGNILSLYINFDIGKSTIKSESKKIVDELYAMLKNNPTLKIQIDGHTDNVGSAVSNKTLSEQRAANVKTALVNKGISADRIKTAGYGQDKPVANNSSEDGKAKNRRVEIKKQ